MKFLELAKHMGLINEDAVKLVLMTQRRKRKAGDFQRVGEIAVDLRFMSLSGRDEVITRQRGLNATDRRPSQVPALRNMQVLTVAVSATLFCGLSIYPLHRPAADTAGIINFGTYVVMVLLEYFQDRQLILSLYKSVKPLFSLSVILVCLHAVRQTLDPSQMQWGNPKILAFLATCLALATGYALWKSHSLRLAECRMGVLKDDLLRIHDILDQSGADAATRCRRAMQTAMKGLRNQVQLHPFNRMLRAVSPGISATTILYFELDDKNGHFVIKEAVYPEGAPEGADKAFEWIRANHFPAKFHEREFERLVKLAKGKGRNEAGWRKRFMIFDERFDHISICGWIYEHNVSLISRNASECLAFDSRFLKILEEQGFSKKDLRWVEVESFMGCPVPGPDGETAGVLLVVKNLRNAVNPEELDALIIASRTIGQILRATKIGK